ncbi:MAG: ATP-binding protein [Fimbriimonas sp.]
MENLEIGRVIGTERKPNTAYTFTFWTPPHQRNVGIGTLVKVISGVTDGEEEVTYGMVVEAHGFNDLESPLHEYLAFDGNPAEKAPTTRPEMRVYQANVLRRYPEEPVSAVPIGKVYLADDADIRRALRTEDFFETLGIPAGCYGTKDAPLAVHVNSEFLLGPESGHLNVTGTSGLAAKTSYILFLLQSIFAHYKDQEGAVGDKGVAALLFNTKGGDLLYLDQRSKEEVSSLDQAMYAKCGFEPGPFAKVRYYAPRAKDGFNLNTVRRNEELERDNETRELSFGLKDVVKHAEVLLSRDDLDSKADGYLQYLSNSFVEADKAVRIGDRSFEPPTTIEDLVTIVKAQLDEAKKTGREIYENHHVYTMRKMMNRLDNLAGRFSGLIASGKGSKAMGPTEEDRFEDRTVYVVDVAQLGTEEQDLVFSALITKLRERMESQTLGVARLVVVVDELNKYAPSGSSDTYVVKSLKEIAARGRYLGLTLFGAQQFRSRVDKEIVGNAATHAFGHIEVEELSQPGYSYFTPAIKEKLGSLEPGEVLLKHPFFTQPIFLRFPKPAVMKGSDGMRTFQKSKEVPIETLIRRQCLLRGAKENAISDALGQISPGVENLLERLRNLRTAPRNADPIKILLDGKRLPQARPVHAVVAASDENDPFESGSF